ncbi:hypothetical protein DFH94DRAFT_678730 [Russula ochroleuca]|uniref:Uncharacterized protein n=1 Tax=Russula ochroleuca TaxID=152965 RepID=A0A9P5N468_9AGAM|nr:hypothetical protein DFH94DRAFT_678730 [Russula ochroleuca]
MTQILVVAATASTPTGPIPIVVTQWCGPTIAVDLLDEIEVSPEPEPGRTRAPLTTRHDKYGTDSDQPTELDFLRTPAPLPQNLFWGKCMVDEDQEWRNSRNTMEAEYAEST